MPTFGLEGQNLLSAAQKKNLTQNAIQKNNLANVTIPARASNQTVFVELGDKPAKANISRNGYRVPSILPDNDRLDVLLSGLFIEQTKKKPRVLDQSIAPGTRVSAGTTIDLVLAPREDINIGIFDNIHEGVSANNIGEILDRVAEQRQLQDLVLRYESAADVPEAERVLLGNLITQTVDIEINDEKPGQSFGNAFNTMQVVYAFT